MTAHFADGVQCPRVCNGLVQRAYCSRAPKRNYNADYGTVQRSFVSALPKSVHRPRQLCLYRQLTNLYHYQQRKAAAGSLDDSGHARPTEKSSNDSPELASVANSATAEQNGAAQPRPNVTERQPQLSTANTPQLERITPQHRWQLLFSGSVFKLPLQLALQSYRLVRVHLLPLLLLHTTTDLLLLLLNRLNHRATNALAVALLPSVTPGAIGNPWYLSSNPEVATWINGYQPLALFMFLALFPVELAARSVAMAITGVLVAGQAKESDVQRKGIRGHVGEAVSRIGQAWAVVRPMFRRVLETDVRVALQAIPLRLLCLVVVPLPWALPRLAALQLAQPLALLKGADARVAVTESQSVMEPHKWGYAAPYAGLFLLLKLLDPLQQLLFDAIPQRWHYELPEVPLLALVAFAVARLLLARGRDVLPYAMLGCAPVDAPVDSEAASTGRGVAVAPQLDVQANGASGQHEGEVK